MDAKGGGSGRDAKRLRNCTEIKIRWEDALKTLLISGRQLMTCWQTSFKLRFSRKWAEWINLQPLGLLP